MVSSFEHGNLYGVKESGEDFKRRQPGRKSGTDQGWHGITSNMARMSTGRTAPLAGAEEAARLKGVGLWRHPKPTPPWDSLRNKKKETLFPGKPIVGVTCI